MITQKNCRKKQTDSVKIWEIVTLLEKRQESVVITEVVTNEVLPLRIGKGRSTSPAAPVRNAFQSNHMGLVG